MKTIMMTILAFTILILVSSCNKDDNGTTAVDDGANTPAETTLTTQGDVTAADDFILLIPPAANNDSRRIIHGSIPKFVLWRFSITRESESVVSIVGGNTCLKVNKSYLSNLEVTVRSIFEAKVSKVDVCGGKDTDIEQKCELGVYELELDGAGLKKVDSAKAVNAICKVLQLDDKED